MLRARHVWIASRVADAFGLDEEEGKAACRKYLAKLNEVLAAEPTAPSHVLAYYQPRDVIGEVRPRRARAPAAARARRRVTRAAAPPPPPTTPGWRPLDGQGRARALLHLRRRGEADGPQGRLFSARGGQARRREGV
jgi:hypothetical protein